MTGAQFAAAAVTSAVLTIAVVSLVITYGVNWLYSSIVASNRREVSNAAK